MRVALVSHHSYHTNDSDVRLTASFLSISSLCPSGRHGDLAEDFFVYQKTFRVRYNEIQVF